MAVATFVVVMHWACACIQVLGVFGPSPELCGLIRGVEGDYARFLHHPTRRPEGPHSELLPWLADQAQEWEAVATAGAATAPTASTVSPN